MHYFADRIGGENFGKDTKIYKFERIKRAKREVMAANPHIPLIDMGVGEPDEPADPALVSVLSREAGKRENRFYSDNGIAEFQEAAGRYLKAVYGVTLQDPRNQIIHGIGSKPVLAMLPICFVNPGEYTLMTVPGYPVLGTYTRYVGGLTYDLPLLPENDFFPDLDVIPEEILKKSKLLYLNYPNNPTGRRATPAFFEKVVAFAKAHHILVIHDASYSSLVYDGCKPLSFLSAEGAMEVGLELFSLSKAFNMTGWRLAFLAGHPELIKAYGTVKDNTDSGQFRAIQKAGVYALSHPEMTSLTADKYSRRLDRLAAALREVGFQAEKPGGTFYCYVPAPVGTKSGKTFRNAAEASEFLIRECLVSTVPWDEAGAYLRFSVTFEADSAFEEQQIIDTVKKRFQKANLIF